ncbi:MAG: nucleotide exchange factor GrpE [Oscillospiraceae bacterium]|nr:nucleotide exchange factor GrpE [Oscillospiraceae bacterium]
MEANQEQTPELEQQNAPVQEEVPVEAPAPQETAEPEQAAPPEQNEAAQEPQQPAEPEPEPTPEPDPPEPPKKPETGKAAESDKLLRLMAEFDNYKKRSIRERENIYSDVRVDTVSRFLPVYDNLCRALSAETADEAYKRGVELIFNQLLGVFQGLGVTEIAAEGQPFDPQLHNAVMHVEDESVGENTVVQELQKGFRLGDRVIRFSMVKVAN